jgi:LysM repeat protein
MDEEYPSVPPPSRPGPSEPWRKQHMVQRVPAHLDEATGTPRWLVIAGIAVGVVIVCALVFFLLGGSSRLNAFGVGSTATPTRTRTPASPPITIIPAIIPTGTPTVGPTAVTIRYRVRPGDTLSALADRYHVPVRVIMQANGLKDETIRIGDDLLIPLPTPTSPPGSISPSGGTPTPISFDSPPSSADTTATPGVIRHIVQRGDTLIGISVIYGSSVSALKAANGLESDALAIGQVIIVPTGPWSPTPTPATVFEIPATLTSQFAYSAPNPLRPAESAPFRGSKDIPVLEWSSPAILRSGEFYIAHIEYGIASSRKTFALAVTQGTSVKLDPAKHYAGASASGTVYSWYVVILSGVISPQGIPQGIAVSPLSVTRTFVWY